nr:hypothetical protein CR513_22217 [Ipomoea batatas]
MRRNWVVMNFNSSAISAKVSTSVKAFTVRVDGGKFAPAFGSSAHVRSSSPQKSLSFRMPRLKKPLLPPSVVTLSMRPRMTKSIPSTGSPSRTMYVFSVNKHGFSRSHMASSSLSSMFANRGTYKQWIRSEYVSRLNQEKAGKNVLSYEETYNHYLTLCCKCNWAQPRDQSVGKNMLGEDETYNHYSRLTYVPTIGLNQESIGKNVLGDEETNNHYSRLPRVQLGSTKRVLAIMRWVIRKPTTTRGCLAESAIGSIKGVLANMLCGQKTYNHNLWLLVLVRAITLNHECIGKNVLGDEKTYNHCLRLYS